MHTEKVLPSDVLILYRSHIPFKNLLPMELGMLVAPDYSVRLVDSDNYANKNFPLLEPGILTVSTLASANGYDAPIVFLMGADDLTDDTKGRAQFYVAATRAKYQLHVSGIRHDQRTLVDEIVEVLSNNVG